MDIDFSQFGQNVAATNVQQDLTRNTLSEQDASNSQKIRQEKANSSQESARQVDNTSTATENVGNIETAVAEVSEFVQARNRQLAFSIDEESKRSVVKVTDSDSGEVIRQIPSEEVLALSERIKELQSDVGAAVGVLFNKQA